MSLPHRPSVGDRVLSDLGTLYTVVGAVSGRDAYKLHNPGSNSAPFEVDWDQLRDQTSYYSQGQQAGVALQALQGVPIMGLKEMRDNAAKDLANYEASRAADPIPRRSSSIAQVTCVCCGKKPEVLRQHGGELHAECCSYIERRTFSREEVDALNSDPFGYSTGMSSFTKRRVA